MEFIDSLSEFLVGRIKDKRFIVEKCGLDVSQPGEKVAGLIRLVGSDLEDAVQEFIDENGFDAEYASVLDGLHEEIYDYTDAELAKIKQELATKKQHLYTILTELCDNLCEVMIPKLMKNVRKAFELVEQNGYNEELAILLAGR